MAALPEKLVNRLVITAVAIGFLTLLGVGLLSGYVLQRNLAFTNLVGHTHEVQQALSEYRVLIERVETARRGYLLAREDGFYATYRQTADSLSPALDDVSRLTRDNPRQQARIVRLRALMAEQRGFAEASVRAARSGSVAPAQTFNLDRAVFLTRAMREITRQMAADEQRLLQERDEARLDSIETLTAVAVAAAVLLALVAIGALWVILRYTRDLTLSRTALQTLNEGLEDAVRARTADLQRANEEIQRFAYIVSHDLRSPLVNVMGFTSELEAAVKPLNALLGRAEAEAPEIVSEDARAAVRGDLPEAIGFIRASTQKMDRLINAILQLSRQGRRVLTPEAVDVKRLLSGISDSLRHRTEETGSVIEIARDMPGVVSDRLALEQIFSNLVENALKYLKPGRPGRIVVSGRREGSRIIYEVADNGRGIDPKDHDRIFDLFRRSGAQDQPGEGIGLAHVRALAYRLGGTVTCDSALDRGATFRVSLPKHLGAEGTAA